MRMISTDAEFEEGLTGYSDAAKQMMRKDRAREVEAAQRAQAAATAAKLPSSLERWQADLIRLCAQKYMAERNKLDATVAHEINVLKSWKDDLSKQLIDGLGEKIKFRVSHERDRDVRLIAELEGRVAILERTVIRQQKAIETMEAKR
jgi:hypothetical protein